MKACDSQVMGIVLALCASLISLGCEKKTQEYRLEQPINMGLFSFEVERTEESVKLVHPSEGPNLEIRVYYRMLDNKTPPFGKTFDETLLGVRIVTRQTTRLNPAGAEWCPELGTTLPNGSTHSRSAPRWRASGPERSSARGHLIFG